METIYRPVYIDDVNEIVEIYHESNSNKVYNTQNNCNSTISENFGVPLFLAVRDTEIISFVSLYLNENSERDLIVHQLNQDANISEHLRKIASAKEVKIFVEDFNNIALRATIERWMMWIN